jgi:hypothetical protein
VPVDDSLRRRELPGRTPFIVPPAAAKSSFYDNPVTKELWQSAARALKNAKRVALVGYSLPITDLVVSGMLADTIADSKDEVRQEDVGVTDAEMVVVNPYPSDITSRLQRLGVSPVRIREVSGDSAIVDFVEELELAAGEEAYRQLETLDPTLRIAAMAGPGIGGVVTSASPMIWGVDLAASKIERFPGVAPSADTGQVQPLTLGRLREVGETQYQPRLEVRFEGAEPRRIVGSTILHDQGEWLGLIPSSRLGDQYV